MGGYPARPAPVGSRLCVHREKVEEVSPLEGRRFRVHEDGTLQLDGATEEDAGQYSCWVVNAKGRAVVTASLDVRSN